MYYLISKRLTFSLFSFVFKQKYIWSIDPDIGPQYKRICIRQNGLESWYKSLWQFLPKIVVQKWFLYSECRIPENTFRKIIEGVIQSLSLAKYFKLEKCVFLFFIFSCIRNALSWFSNLCEWKTSFEKFHTFKSYCPSIMSLYIFFSFFTIRHNGKLSRPITTVISNLTTDGSSES